MDTDLDSDARATKSPAELRASDSSGAGKSVSGMASRRPSAAHPMNYAPTSPPADWDNEAGRPAPAVA